MRGKVLEIVLLYEFCRITPAYAGKSIAYTLFSSRTWDHPRLCGEKPKTRVLQMLVTGSPPPMRGKAL